MVSTLLLKKISAASGLYFGVFLIMHLVSHYSAIFGIDYAMKNMTLFRRIYQNPAFEIGLFIALVVHMISNTMIYMHRQKIERRASKFKKNDDASTTTKIEPPGTFELKGHRYTGYFLSIAVIGHVSATRIVPFFILKDPSQFDYTFATYAQKAIFGPIFSVYLILLGMAGGWHLIYGTRSAIVTLLYGSSVTGKPFPFALKPLAALNHILIINAVLAICGVYYAVDTETKADLYDVVYSYVPF
jgi:Succinate dehydrogenase/Fumarate reductase transmembrane subunit